MNDIPAPYPRDTRAKGWRFEIDMETVKASDTWLRAKSGLLRGALVLLWAEAWQQTPCGTLPNDDELVALLIDMAPTTFAKHRAVLMRGWWLADDGRLYHNTITSRVLSMLDKRASDAQRAQTRRDRAAGAGKTHAGVTGASRVTPPGPTREFDTKHQAPSTKEEIPPATRVPLWSAPAWMPSAEWEAFIAMRKAKGKRAPFTDAARDGIVLALAKLRAEGHDIAAALQESVNNGWSGVFAPKANARAGPPQRQTATERQIDTMNALTGRSRSHDRTDQPGPEIIDVPARVVA